MPAIGQAPGELRVLQAFVNTLDIEQSTDELTSEQALADWLTSAHLLDRGSEGQAGSQGGELASAVALREALRGVLRSHVTHAGQHAPDDSVSQLRRLAAGRPTRLEVGPDGQVAAAAAGSGVQAGLTRLLLIAAEAATAGTWRRLKVCSADDCQWAFYDRSPTRSGCWCSMQICGSRAKSRAYRQRYAAPKPAAG